MLETDLIIERVIDLTKKYLKIKNNFGRENHVCRRKINTKIIKQTTE